MALQYDFSSGLDLSGLTSVTQAQLMQAINQLAPLSNIGGVLYGTPTQFNATFIADNPRCIRYILLDTTTTPPTPKYWDTSGTPGWESVTVADDSITYAKMKATESNVRSFQHFFDDTITEIAYADMVLTYDTGGRFIVQKSRDTFMTGYLLPITQLNPAGADSTKRYIRWTGSAFAYAAIDPATDLSDGAVPISKLIPGTANYLLKSSGSAWLAVSNDDSASNFLPSGSDSVGVNVSKLKGNAAAPIGSVIRRNSVGGTEWAAAEYFYKENGLVPPTASGITISGLHGITGGPEIVQVRLRCIGNASGVGHTWDVADSIDLNSGLLKTTAGGIPYFIHSDATTIRIIAPAGSGSGLEIQKKDRSGPIAITLAQVAQDFVLDVRAWTFNRT